MDPHRAAWNRQQKNLQHALSQPDQHTQAIELFLSQHAQVHTARMAQLGLWSFEDEVCQGLAETAFRRIPPKGEHSIAWILWHLARIEDVTMNLLVAGSEQLLQVEGWLEKMRLQVKDTGNATDVARVTQLSAAIDLDALHAYRLAVGRRTRQIVSQLTPHEIVQVVDPARLRQVSLSGAVVAEACDVLEYWGRRTIAGLLLMPPTRHCFLHLNEAMRIRREK
jgi:hypothetical protein